jgi:hypothetical protein
MNEVEPWSSRARHVVGHALDQAWQWFTDLGQGAWLLALSVVVVAAIGLAVVEGRNDPGGTPCSQAEPYVMRMEGLTSSRHHPRLDDADMAWLHNASARLTAISGRAFGDDVAAIELAARTAAQAQPGKRMNAGTMATKFDAACGYRI